MLPPIDPVHIRDELTRIGERLREAQDDTAQATAADPRGLTEALADALDALQCRARNAASGGANPEVEPDGTPGVTADDGTAGVDVGKLGDHAIAALLSLIGYARGAELAEEAQTLTALLPPLACCIARAGGELTLTGPLVDAIAAVSRRLRAADDVMALLRMADEIAAAVSPRVTDAPPGSEPQRAWHVLLLSRAAMATRTLRPHLMEAAFDTLIDQSPEAATAFFREGMEQVERQDYPPEVQAVMRRYFEAWGGNDRLH